MYQLKVRVIFKELYDEGSFTDHIDVEDPGDVFEVQDACVKLMKDGGWCPDQALHVHKILSIEDVTNKPESQRIVYRKP